MNKRLYVGNLAYNVNDKELQDLFSQVGNVVYAKVITRTDGKSKGFGFVEMSNEDEAKAAIEKYENFLLYNREMKVNEAKAQEQVKSNYQNRRRNNFGNNRNKGSGFKSQGSGFNRKSTSSGFKSRESNNSSNNSSDSDNKKRYSSDNSSSFGNRDLNQKLMKLRKDLNSKLDKKNN